MLRALVLASLLALVVAAPAAADQWEKSFTVTGRLTFVLRCGDADVYVTNSAGKSVGVRVTSTRWTIGQHVRVTASQSGDRIECEVREPRMSFNFNWHRNSLRVDVSLPRDADVDIASSDGRVTLAPLTGVERVHTGDGDIEADGLAGELHLSTSDGAIRARGLDGSVEATSSDGAIEIEGRFDRLDLETSDGHVEASALAGSKVASGWSLRSGDGRLRLRIPSDLAADLDLHSGDGSIRLDLPIQVTGQIARHDLRGKLNGGGAVIRMRSGDGSIRVEPS